MEKLSLIIGVGQVTLLIRHSRSLKDKRQVLKSIETKLRNDGWSVVECGYADNHRKAMLGFTYAGKSATHVDKLLDDAFRLFDYGVELTESQRDVFDYSEMKDEEYRSDPEGRWFDEDDT